MNVLEQTRWVGCKGTTRRVYTHNRGRGYIADVGNKTKQVTDLILHLQRKGIFVPRITKVYSENHFVEFEKGGKTFANFLAKLSSESERVKKMPAAVRLRRLQQQKRANYQILTKIFRMMGRVHSLGIRHGHPHPGNIVLQGNRVGLIDFKFAHWVSKECWKSHNSLFLGFWDDYMWLGKILSRLAIQPKKRTALWRGLVSRYPCSEEIKQQLMKRIEQWSG
ncbi:MAG: hypothetical protein V1777_02780 [Candidatus Micrarchaeota archaeon]